MPYNIWCDGCKNHIGMGVRYNAEKKQVGKYYTTPIYRFRMKCHLCVNYIEMQTDPASCEYVIVSGARRKEERWDPEDNGQVLTTEHEQKQRLETDAMFRLEHGAADRGTLRKALPALSDLQEAQSAWKDDFGLNSLLRRRFRERKKGQLEEERRDQALQAKASLDIPLLPETDADRRLAALLTLHTLDSYEDKQKLKRSEITQRSWFPAAPGPASSTPKTSSRVLKKLLQARRAPPTSGSITGCDLGIVRRPARGGDPSNSPQLQGTSQDSPSISQDRPIAPQDSPTISQDMSITPQESWQDAPQTPEDQPPKGLSSSLVADYSDSESE
ncbi:probable splicing factor YJU2B [Suncus etruscus]|uniref:probable splicing factor YJU2B n=1 Tax=Suncus etruscus TaxID=109475 RepID=UPI002110E33A|nr:probable splicing factor YJU2B [Suncus etruscus]